MEQASGFFLDCSFYPFPAQNSGGKLSTYEAFLKGLKAQSCGSSKSVHIRAFNPVAEKKDPLDRTNVSSKIKWKAACLVQMKHAALHAPSKLWIRNIDSFLDVLPLLHKKLQVVQFQCENQNKDLGQVFDLLLFIAQCIRRGESTQRVSLYRSIYPLILAV